MGASGHTGATSDPANIAAHDFDKHDAMTVFGTWVELIDGLGGDREGSGKTKSEFAGVLLIVEGVANADC